MCEERLRFLVRRRRGHDDDVHTAHLVDLVVDDLGKISCSRSPERVVAAAVEALGRHPAGSRARAAARTLISRSRNSYIARRRSVTLAPIGTPSRSLKFAIDFLARVTTGF